MMQAKKLCAGMLAVAASLTPATASPASDWIRSTLGDARGYAQCSAEHAAIEGTLGRFSGIELPETGKVIVVNIPSGIVTAYEDGVAVIESKAVVGKDSTPTPELDTHVTYVRPNPTWTVPESIIKRNGWREKLGSDPQFFADSNFLMEMGGQLVSPFDAAADPWAVGYYVQQPGPGNALGSVKIGLHNSDAIYLHDTNDPSKFDIGFRAASAGCVRIEEVHDLSSWILGLPSGSIEGMIEAGDQTNHQPPEPVKVILGYYTAWPDATGMVRYYSDIYGLDGGGESCARPENEDGFSAPYRDPFHDPVGSGGQGPRFEPGLQPVTGTNGPSPVWSEYQAR